MARCCILQAWTDKQVIPWPTKREILLMAALVQLLERGKCLTLFRCVFILITVSGDRQLQAECMALALVLRFATDAPPLILFEAGEQSVSRCCVQQEGTLFTVWLVPTVLVA